MAENVWGDEGAPAPAAKKRIPSWMWWGCGGGCLLLLLAGAAAAVLGYRLFQTAMDPEKAWADVQVILPYDQRPAGWTAHGTSLAGMGIYSLTAVDPPASLIVQRFPSKAELDNSLDPDAPQNRGIFGFATIRDAEVGTIQVQGREVRCLHFKLPDADRNARGGGSVRIDVSGKGSFHVQVQITSGAERVTEEQVAQVLTPFDVWRGR